MPLRNKTKRDKWLSQRQYDMLKLCSEKKDASEWNEWRKNHPNSPVFLENADFTGCHLVNVCFSCGNLSGSNFTNAKLSGSDFSYATLDFANFQKACLLDTEFHNAELGATIFEDARLGKANLSEASIAESDFSGANLQDAEFINADLKGAKFQSAVLLGTKFDRSNISGDTLIDDDCYIDNHTSFLSVGLDSMRIGHSIKMRIEYYIRRRRWRQWYKSRHWSHRWLTTNVARMFWWMSDYGSSTRRVVFSFLFSSLFFAVIYTLWPSMLDGLIPNECWTPLRALYFSIVTMTTLGFGDIHAAKDSNIGHMVLMMQVLLGYIMLGALVTRFGILFTAGGPAMDNPKMKVL